MKFCKRCAQSKDEADFHADRSRSDGRAAYCKACCCAKTRAWNAANPERASESSRRWYQENKDRAQALSAAWYAANPERSREIKRRHKAKMRQEQPERVAVTRRLEMSKRRLTGVDVTYGVIVARDPCAYCGDAGGTIDHIMPLAYGGSNDWENLTGACLSCNSRKSDKLLLAWLGGRS